MNCVIQMAASLLLQYFSLGWARRTRSLTLVQVSPGEAPYPFPRRRSPVLGGTQGVWVVMLLITIIRIIVLTRMILTNSMLKLTIFILSYSYSYHTTTCTVNRTAGITAAAATSSRNYCKPLLINLKNFVRIMGSRKLLRLTTQSFSVPKHRLANYPPQNLGGKVTSKVKVVCYWFGGLWFWDFRLCSHAPMLNNERANTARK